MRSRVPLYFLFVPLLAALFQLSMKLAAHTMAGMQMSFSWFSLAISSPWVWTALLSEAASFVLWIKILATYDLSRAFPITGISYVLVLATGWVGFHEPIYTLQLLGTTLILAGVWVIGTATQTTEVTS